MIPKRLVSFLLPTRGRPERLLMSLRSLRQTCNDLMSYELLNKADLDDQATIDAVTNLRDPHVTMGLGERGRGYLDLHVMCNQLAAMASGMYIFLWNDDAQMVTQGWDSILRDSMGQQPKIFKPSSAGHQRNIFPIMDRRIYEAMGRFSESALNDFYTSTIAQRCGIETPIAIDIKHDHPFQGGTNLDQTYLDAVEACKVCKHDDTNPHVMKCMDEDVAKVMVLLANQK